jgi:hypothetical protein
MYSIKIDANQAVNPCIITREGDFAPEFHSLYITSDDSYIKNMFNNWYLGTIWIVNKKIPKKKYSEIITRVSQKLDLIINFSNSDEFSLKINARIAQFIIELKKETKDYADDIYISDYSKNQKIIEKITSRLQNKIG